MKLWFNSRESDHIISREVAAQEPSPQKKVEVPEQGGSFEERMEVVSTGDRAMTVAAMYRALDIRSSMVAKCKLEMLVYDQENKYYKLNMSEKEGKRMNYLMQVCPNPRQNASQFWKFVQQVQDIKGCCVIYPWRVGEDVTELIPCDIVSWNNNNNTYNIGSTLFGINIGEVRADRIIILRGITTPSHPLGISLIASAARTMTLAATSEKLSLETAAKGGKNKFIIKQEQQGAGLHGLVQFNDEQMAKSVKRLNEQIYKNDVIYDPTAGNVTPLAFSMQDLQIIETRKLSVADIARYTGVPLALLFDATGSNYKAISDNDLTFLKYTLQPQLKQIEDEFNSKLLSMSDFGGSMYRFNTSALTALDIKTMGEANKVRLETGQASVNELRKEQNMPLIPDGDDHYVSCNVAKVGSAKLSGEQTTTNKEG